MVIEAVFEGDTRKLEVVDALDFSTGTTTSNAKDTVFELVLLQLIVFM